MIRIGCVNIDISHPGTFAKKMEVMQRGKYVALYNDGFRTDEEVDAFIAEYRLEKRCRTIEELVEMVDIGFVHDCNWDKHLQHAMPFIKAGKPVFMDKPICGNLRDCHELERLVNEGAKILGSSSVRYADEFEEIKKALSDNNEEIISVYGTAGVDEFNYGVHIMEGIQGLLGTGAYSVKYIGTAAKAEAPVEQYYVTWKNGIKVIYQLQTGVWQPFDVVVTTNKARGIHSFRVDTTQIYDAVLKRIFDYMEKGVEMASIGDLTETIKIYLAGKASREHGGKEIKLDDLRLDDKGYDGYAFEEQYALAARRNK
ncbi:MAG: Gfo/Idh/MocA family oxidoreductase [Candidatus Latescibacteria bacterium]|nr:Gfo/Idh/MocA family oxidoreductase [Candidatus Latescibacterota bacterium]